MTNDYLTGLMGELRNYIRELEEAKGYAIANSGRYGLGVDFFNRPAEIPGDIDWVSVRCEGDEVTDYSGWFSRLAGKDPEFKGLRHSLMARKSAVQGYIDKIMLEGTSEERELVQGIDLADI